MNNKKVNLIDLKEPQKDLQEKLLQKLQTKTYIYKIQETIITDTIFVDKLL